MLNPLIGRAAWLIGCLSLLVLAHLQLVYGVVCNGKVHEDPASLCGPALPACAGHDPSCCAPTVNCDGSGICALGYERKRVPRSCERGLKHQHCRWAKDLTLCYEVFACKKDLITGKCIKLICCSTVEETFKQTTAKCVVPG